MDILQYLIELLKTRKQIGIEGLGTLYKKKTPGRYDAETHSFLPPSYALEFTSDVLEHANLAEYIQNERGISEDSAKYFINQFVDEVKKALQNGEYEMENLGTFSALGGEVIFIPSRDINTGFDFFALPPITAQAVPPKKEEEAPIEEDKEVEADQLPLATEEPEVEQVEVPEFEEEVNKVELAEEEVPAPQEIEEELIEEPVSDAEQELENTEEELPEVEPTEEQTEEIEQVTPTIEDDKVEETESSATIENNDIADSKVVEEIAQAGTENPVEETESKVEAEEEQQTWDFNNEQVVSAEDINKEENFVNDHASTPTTTEEPAIAIAFEEDEKANDFKLKSTTHEWDFNNIESKKEIEEETLIGEFDKENFEEEVVIEKTKMPLYQKVGFGLIALLVLIVILYFVKPDIFQNFERDTTNPDEKIVVPIQRSNLKTQKDSISFADSIMKNAEKVGLDVEPAKDTLKVTTTKKEVPTTYTFDVIIASFATDAKAQIYIARMKKKGFDAKISTMHGKRKNISIATYNNIDSAQKYVTKFRKQFNNEDIYAQPIKNK